MSRAGLMHIPADMQAMWDGGQVKRFHVADAVGCNTVGHHSYGVACVLMHVWPDAPARLLRAALKHDMAERHVGDIPSPAKRVLSREALDNLEDSYLFQCGIPTEKLAPWERWLIKFCDNVDGLWFTIRERSMGNRLIEDVAANYGKYIVEMLSVERCVSMTTYKRCKELAAALEKEWEYVNK